jgi:hypothetical protein
MARLMRLSRNPREESVPNVQLRASFKVSRGAVGGR